MVDMKSFWAGVKSERADNGVIDSLYVEML